MQRQFELRYDRALVRAAVFAFWARAIGLMFPLATFGLLLVVAFLVSRGDRSWTVGALATLVAVACLLIIAIFVVHYLNVLRKLQDLNGRGAMLTVAESAFTIQSAGGSATQPWASVREVWKFRHFWLLLFSRSHFITIPVHDLSPEIQEYMLNRLSDAKARVR
ncbi:YcxB family protein [Ideonella sp. A 288]|uniref:YcxB family protein n=1 Tax=Ideonella sp. A 288 TaxID=1962181 RepID=UPI000B4B729A|nr:YcxB family protein [Ideonella sp. A 288]